MKANSNNFLDRNFLYFFNLILLVYSTAFDVNAATLDCTSGCNNSFNFGAVWSTEEVKPAGSGVLNSFVQLQNTGTQEGYNTTANNILDNGPSNQFNHELFLSAVPIKTISGSDYREFVLDISEPLNNTDEYLSLDGLQLYFSNIPNQSTTNINSLGYQIYNLDSNENNTVLLNASFIGSGNGASDLFVYIPEQLFLAAFSSLGNSINLDPYIYLWSKFGELGVPSKSETNFGSSGSFEEWAVGSPSKAAVPEPTSLGLLGISLLALKRKLKKG